MTATMEQDQLEKLRYPTGKFEWGKEYSEDDTQKLIEKIEDFPAKFEKLVRSMRNDQLDTAYREGGWTVRQVIHHLFDSHVNAYTRFKLALFINSTARPSSCISIRSAMGKISLVTKSRAI